MNIKIGNYDVHSNGTVIGIVNEPITFQIENLTFEFHFLDDKEDKEQKMTTEIPEDGTRLILNFKNFNNSLGTGNLSPLKVANLNNREFLLSYRVYALTDNAGKMLHYTWMFGEKVEGGNNEQ